MMTPREKLELVLWAILIVATLANIVFAIWRL